MITQRPISVRLDKDYDALLTYYALVKNYPKNRLINNAVRHYIRDVLNIYDIRAFLKE